jgi:hypothetical protein
MMDDFERFARFAMVSILVFWFAVTMALVCLGCSSPTAPTGPQPPLGPPLVVKGPNDTYYQNPLVTLPPGVTINPNTGAIVYPPDWGQR